MFRSTANKGFQLTFENGIEISVQFGNNNYCQNKEDEKNSQSVSIYGCEDAEVAVSIKGKKIYHCGDLFKQIFGYEAPGEWYEGYLSADTIAEMIYKAKNFQP